MSRCQRGALIEQNYCCAGCLPRTQAHPPGHRGVHPALPLAPDTHRYTGKLLSSVNLSASYLPQVLRLGQVLLLAVPGEFTTMAGRSVLHLHLDLPLHLHLNLNLHLHLNLHLQEAEGGGGRDGGYRGEQGGGGGALQHLHPLHHHLGGVPETKVCHPMKL